MHTNEIEKSLAPAAKTAHYNLPIMKLAAGVNRVGEGANEVRPDGVQHATRKMLRNVARERSRLDHHVEAGLLLEDAAFGSGLR